MVSLSFVSCFGGNPAICSAWPCAMSGLEALMNCLMSATVCVRLNLATIRDPSDRRSWMDVAGWDSSTPAQGLDTVVDAGGCDVLPVAVLEGPAKRQSICLGT